MQQPYKDKISNIIESCEGRIRLLDYMIDGTKKADTQEAKRYIREVQKGLEQVQELVSVS